MARICDADAGEEEEEEGEEKVKGKKRIDEVDDESGSPLGVLTTAATIATISHLASHL